MKSTSEQLWVLSAASQTEGPVKFGTPVYGNSASDFNLLFKTPPPIA